VFVLLVWLLVFTIRYREKMKFLREQERVDYDRIRELDAMKTRFFTNVSHEFRTPLTLILTPLDKLLKEVNDTSIHNQLLIVRRNGRRLLNLVNQLLDFRKLEVDKIVLKPSYGDIIPFAAEAFNSFVDLFESKRINYNFLSSQASYFVNFDYDKMEKIIFNLLSNAVKFTPENGAIDFLIKVVKKGDAGYNDSLLASEYLEIRVNDDGIGIPTERVDKVFERFFQSDDNSAVINQGSGIGLSLTMEFVKMHGGDIVVESQLGKGSCFVLRLPLDTNAPAADSLIGEQQSEFADEEQHEEVEIDTLKGDKPKVLIVEDNEDLKFYLSENLKNHYTIIEASNGVKGWELTCSVLPHLVVSDIMMAGINGIDLCKKIKNDSRTSHIPVILLTARTSDEQKIEGLEAGAEDYITKPFSYEVLELKIKRLIELRLSFQKKFSGKYEIEPAEIGITSLDEKFLKKALKLVEKNIGNSEFSVEKMGKELGVSRGHLYNKLMALTGKSPVEFIRVMRLKRAAQYLGKSQLSISEIAFQVGFNDPKYFSRYFKEEFGVVPSEYAKNHQGVVNVDDDEVL
jgi:signal transduction histidine kinase/DNA-binding response OmpR family regulator